MRAVVRVGSGEGQMELREIPKPECRAGDALVRVAAVGVCGSDYAMWKGKTETKIPVVIGHELAGTVESIGEQTTRVKSGDRVVSLLNIGSCGGCKACRSGNPQMCEFRTCPGYKINGAFAEYITLPDSMLIRVDDAVSMEDAALTEPLAVVSHALLLRTRIEASDNVVIFGPGPIGLIAALLARHCGAGNIVMVGTAHDKAKRLPLALEMGADYVYADDLNNAETAIRKMLGGNGADVVVEASGTAPAINLGLRLLRKLGRMCVLGNTEAETNPIAWQTAVGKSISIIFTYSSSPASWDIATRLLSEKSLNLGRLISHRMPLASFREAFAEIEAGSAVKCILFP